MEDTPVFIDDNAGNKRAYYALHFENDIVEQQIFRHLLGPGVLPGHCVAARNRSGNGDAPNKLEDQVEIEVRYKDAAQLRQKLNGNQDIAQLYLSDHVADFPKGNRKRRVRQVHYAAGPLRRRLRHAEVYLDFWKREIRSDDVQVVRHGNEKCKWCNLPKRRVSLDYAPRFLFLFLLGELDLRNCLVQVVRQPFRVF